MRTYDACDMTIVTACYGQYWDQFSQAWEQSIVMLDPRPAEIVLVTDVPRSIQRVRNIVIGQAHMADYFNAGAKAAETEWVVVAGFDDIWLPHAMSSFQTDADAYGYPMILTGIRQGLFGYSGGFESILNVSHNPMLGGFFHRRKLLKEIPFRRFGWYDWAHFAEMRYLGRTFDAGQEPRSLMVRHDKAHSLVGNAAYQREIDDFKAQLRAGNVTLQASSQQAND